MAVRASDPPGAIAGGARPATPLWRLQSDAVVERMICDWLPGGAAALKTDLYDEAVGPGLAAALSSRFGEVSGIDADPEVVAAASESHPGLAASVADVRELPFADGTFDAVLSNSTLDHLPDRGQVVSALRELRRVLKPGGSLLITIDNRLNPAVALRNALPARIARRVRGGFDYEPGWSCGPRGLRAVLEEAGFAVSDRAALLHAPRFAVARMTPGEGGRRLARVLAFERLGRSPLRYLTGHFVAALARAPE